MSRATYLPRPGESEKHLYVIGRILDGEWSRVLCGTSASGGKTLPVFSHREAARRFLRASLLRFNLLGSGWRTKEISGSEACAFSLGPRRSPGDHARSVSRGPRWRVWSRTVGTDDLEPVQGLF